MPRRGDICDFFNATMFRYYLRKKYKRSETFAKRVGVSRQSVDAWKNGQKKPTWRHVIKISWVLKISVHQLILPKHRYILNKWEDHLVEYIEAQPEIKHEKQITIKDKDGSSNTTKTVQRELKLTTKEAMELSEKLGYLPREADKETPAEPDSLQKDIDLHQMRYTPEEGLDEEDADEQIED